MTVQVKVLVIAKSGRLYAGEPQEVGEQELQALTLQAAKKGRAVAAEIAEGFFLDLSKAVAQNAHLTLGRCDPTTRQFVEDTLVDTVTDRDPYAYTLFAAYVRWPGLGTIMASEIEAISVEVTGLDGTDG